MDGSWLCLRRVGRLSERCVSKAGMRALQPCAWRNSNFACLHELAAVPELAKVSHPE